MTHFPPVKEKTIEEIDSDNLLRIIEEGDATRILSEQNLTKGFNELLKYDLITIKDGEVCLTEKGIEAKTSGMKEYLGFLYEEPKLTEVPKESLLTPKKAYILVFLILLGFSSLLLSIL